jgi:hypothetical protein
MIISGCRFSDFLLTSSNHCFAYLVQWQSQPILEMKLYLLACSARMGIRSKLRAGQMGCHLGLKGWRSDLCHLPCPFTHLQRKPKGCLPCGKRRDGGKSTKYSLPSLTAKILWKYQVLDRFPTKSTSPLISASQYLSVPALACGRFLAIVSVSFCILCRPFVGNGVQVSATPCKLKAYKIQQK